MRLLLRGLRAREVAVAAEAIGIDVGELRRQFAGGRSIAGIASGAGVTAEEVIGAVVADSMRALDEILTAATASREAVDEAKARPPLWAARLVQATKNDLRQAMRRQPSESGGVHLLP